MSLVYIVDGYNVIKCSGRFGDKELRAGREAFFSFLENDRPHGSRANTLIVVFDGSQEVFGLRVEAPFEVIFTQGETADDMIKRMVSESGNPKSIVVVTDDRDLGRCVRASGAGLMSSGVFLAKGGRLRQPEARDATLGLNIVEREKITEELKRIWIKKRS